MLNYIKQLFTSTTSVSEPSPTPTNERHLPIPTDTELLKLFEPRCPTTFGYIKTRLEQKCNAFNTHNNARRRDTIRRIMRILQARRPRTASPAGLAAPTRIRTPTDNDRRRPASPAELVGARIFSRDKINTYINSVEALRSLYMDNPETVWIIDCEHFTLINSKVPVLFEFSVRTITGEELLSCTVDYGMRSEQVWEQIQDWTDRSTRQSPRFAAFVSIFNTFYGPTRTTHGLTLQQIRTELIRLGFDSSTHRLLSWFCTQDYDIFERIMYGPDGGLVVDKLPRRTKRPIEVAKLCRVLQDGGSCALDSLHKRMFPGLAYTYHRASDDTKAMCDVIKRLLDEAR